MVVHFLGKTAVGVAISVQFHINFGIEPLKANMIWKVIKDKVISARLLDETYYDTAIDEIASGVTRPGLWAKALVEAGGDERLQKGHYIKLLVLALKDEQYMVGRVQAALVDEASTRALKSFSSRSVPGVNKPIHPMKLFPYQEKEMRAVEVIYNGKYFECGAKDFDDYDEAIQYGVRRRAAYGG